MQNLALLDVISTLENNVTLESNLHTYLQY